MRALRKQATSHCSGERIQSLRVLFVMVSHSFEHYKNTAQQQVQRKTSAFATLSGQSNLRCSFQRLCANDDWLVELTVQPLHLCEPSGRHQFA